VNIYYNLLAGIAILFSIIGLTLYTDICTTMDLEFSGPYIIDNPEIFDNQQVRVYGEVRRGHIYSGGVQIAIEGLEEEGVFHISGTYSASEGAITVTEATKSMDSKLAFSFLGGLLILYIVWREFFA
jgi:hypothetical protein